MSNPSNDLRRIIDEFAGQCGVTPDQVANLKTTINASPVLIDQIVTAISGGHLKHLALIPAGGHADGTYNGNTKTLSLRSASLVTKSASQPDGEFSIGNLTFLLGHEIQHGFNHAIVAQAKIVFRDEARREARRPEVDHDYTSIVRPLVAAHRNNEAAAEIAGWNAWISHLKSTDSSPSLRDIYERNVGRMVDFIDKQPGKVPTYTLKPDLSLNPDLTISPTPANLEAMGTNFFDKAPDQMRIGDLGKSDYATYYGVETIQEVLRYESRRTGHRIVFDMATLNLDEKLLEEEGIDLGRIKTPRPYYDSSQTPAALRYFDHTQDGSVSPRHNHQHVPIAPLTTTASITGRRLFSDSSHPDNALYVELKQLLPPETSADRLAQITLAAKLGGVEAGQMQNVAVKDDAVFVVGKTPGDRAKVDLSTPPLTEQEAMQRSETFDRQHAQTLEYRAQQAQLNSQGQVGPRMTF